MAHPVFRDRYQGVRNKNASYFVTLSSNLSGLQAGDLVVLQISARDGNAVTIPTLGWLRLVFAGASDPSAEVWYNVYDPDNDVVSIQPSSATDTIFRFTVFEAGTYVPEDFIFALANGSASDIDPNPDNITLGTTHPAPPWNGWQTADNHVGLAHVAIRPNRSFTTTTPSQWDQDNTQTTSTDTTFEGLRIRAGRSINRSSKTYSPGAIQISANGQNAYSSVYVRGKYAPQQGAGAGFTWVQAQGSFRLTFTSVLEEYPDAELTTWDFGDGSDPVSGLEVSHTFAAGAGDYTVTLHGENNIGFVDIVIVVTVNPIPPVPDFSWAQEVGTWRVLYVDQTAYADSLLWELWHGTDTSGPPDFTTTEADHAYDYTAVAPGSFATRLTATNAGGSASVTRIVTLDTILLPPDRPDGVAVLFEILMQGRWLPIQCEVRDASWAWGTNDDSGPLSVVEPTALSITLTDDTRDWDAENTSSPYYGLWDAGSWVRMRVGVGTVMVSSWLGTLVDFTHDLSFAYFTCNDFASRLANFDTDLEGQQVLPEQTAGSRISALLDVAGWPDNWRDIEPGGSVLQGVTISDQSVWESLIDVQRSDIGGLWVTATGVVTYRGRSTMWSGAPYSEVIGCPTPEGDTPILGIQKLTLGGATDNLVNTVRVGVVGEEAQTFERQESIDKYGRYPAVQDDLVMSGSELSGWANFILDRVSFPSYGGRKVTTRLTPEGILELAQLRWGETIRIYDDTHGAPIDFEARFLGAIFTMDTNVIQADLIVSRLTDPGAVSQQAVIDNDTEWNTGALTNVAPTDGVLELTDD